LIDSTVNSLVSGFSNMAQCVLVFRAVAHGLEHLEDQSLEEVRRLIQDRCQKPRAKVVLEAPDAGPNRILRRTLSSQN